MKFSKTLSIIPIVCIILGLFSCQASGSPGSASDTSNHFYNVSLPRISDNIVKTLKIDNMVQTIFKIDDGYYGSTFTDGKYTYYMGESKDSDMEIASTPLKYKGEQVYSWCEGKGAAYEVNYYITYCNAELILLADIDDQVSYADLDGDGNCEIIASSTGFIPGDVVIYFWDGTESGGIKSLDVVNALHAYSAYYLDECFFVTGRENGPEVQYTYSDGKFIKK